LATPSYDVPYGTVESNKGNHIITFAKDKIITLAKQAHNPKTFASSKNTTPNDFDDHSRFLIKKGGSIRKSSASYLLFAVFMV